MREFTRFNKMNAISLQKMMLDEEASSKLAHMDGMRINECCNCCNCKCDSIECGQSRQFAWYYNESDICNMLKCKPKVCELSNLALQFNNSRVMFSDSDAPLATQEPLYFKDKDLSCDGLCQANEDIQHNKMLHDMVTSLASNLGLQAPVVLERKDKSIQLFFIKATGTNGQEGSIKSSLLEVYNLLNSLDSTCGVANAQVLDVSIDSVDDLYDFVVTCDVDMIALYTKAKQDIMMMQDEAE